MMEYISIYQQQQDMSESPADPNKKPTDPNSQSKINKFLSNLNPSQAIGNLFQSVNHLVFSKDSHLYEVRKTFNKLYDQLPLQVANFKSDYLYKIGDNTTRMIITSVISIPLWIVTNRNNPVLYRVRNLAFIFAGVGIFFCPEIFNPFLPEIKTKAKGA